MNKNHFQYVFNSNNLTKYNSFINILINLDFDSTDCAKNFKAQITKIDSNVENFFDIYGFFNLNFETDSCVVKSKWEELKNELMENKSNGVFEIYLNLFKTIKKKSINSHIQLKIIDSICKILSNQELKNIYDDYYFHWYTNYEKTNGDKIKKSIERIKLIDKVYDNIFIKPIIKSEKVDISKMKEDVVNYKSTLEKEYNFDFSKQDNKTPEELEKLYRELNEIKSSIDVYDDMTPDEIHKQHLDDIERQLINMKKHKNEISNPQINYNYMDFLTELANKHKITNTTDLMNYYYWKQMTNYDVFTDLLDEHYNGHNRKYIKNANNKLSNYNLFSNYDLNDTYKDKFINKFDIGEFETWCINNSNIKSDKKNINTLETEYAQLIEMRKAQNKGIEKYFDTDRLNYFANREFTLRQLWDECDYGTTINNDLLIPYMDENYIQTNKINDNENILFV